MIKKYDEFFKGYELEAYELFGSHRKNRGVEFTVWAPHAFKVEVFTSRNWQEFFPMKKID